MTQPKAEANNEGLPPGFVPVWTFVKTEDGVVEYAHPADEALKAATVAREDRHVWQGWGDNVLRCTRCGVKDFSLGSRAPLGPCPQAKASSVVSE